ncbi:protein disulfide oxidoreductase [Aliivibrio fischeri]|uniref:Protein disulfide oxidoreductase n=1 Tax=Aliivibrio fischeri TaxID=668 RepID=A0A510UIE7_ALIFS|nr:protein disulfide oxidoreductase [Aliivibrio fischeri]GEK14412.1 protein disulfide oxidoreductase [Aliivibrio fischeri]
MGKRQKMKRWGKETLIYLLVIIIFSFAIDAWRTKDMPANTAPVLAGISTTGEAIDVIAMSQEKPVVVYFWATWCAACRFVTPTINWFSDTYQVVGVSTSSGEDRRVFGYMTSHDYTFKNMNDMRGDISREWGIRVTPTIVIIDKGEIKNITTGITTPVGLLARLWLI